MRLHHKLKHTSILEANLRFECFYIQCWLSYVEGMHSITIGGGAEAEHTIFILHSSQHTAN